MAASTLLLLYTHVIDMNIWSPCLCQLYNYSDYTASLLLHVSWLRSHCLVVTTQLITSQLRHVFLYIRPHSEEEEPQACSPVSLGWIQLCFMISSLECYWSPIGLVFISHCQSTLHLRSSLSLQESNEWTTPWSDNDIILWWRHLLSFFLKEDSFMVQVGSRNVWISECDLPFLGLWSPLLGKSGFPNTEDLVLLPD